RKNACVEALVEPGRNTPSLYAVNGRPVYVHLTLQRHLFISLLISIRCAICTSSVLTAFASPILLISMSCKALYFKYLHTMKEKSNTCANITSQYWLKMR